MSFKCKRVIYAFPHAGASAAVYRPWVNLIHNEPGALLQPIEIPGRGVLGKEPGITQLDELVERLANNIAIDFQHLQDQGASEWISFGHSFGGVLSVAVCAALAAKHGMSPLFSVVSASIAPSVQQEDDLHLYSDDQLLQKLKEDQATPNALLNEPAFARPILAQLRNDYRLRSQFSKLSQMRVEHPLTLIGAAEDPYVSAEQMLAWHNHSSANIQYLNIPGNHFAIYRHQDLVKQTLLQDFRYSSMSSVNVVREVRAHDC